MRRRVFLSGDWLAAGPAGAGLLSRRTLCGRIGRGCRCQLVQVSRPEAAYGALPLPAPQKAGEGSRGPRRARPRAAGIAASILLRAWRAGWAGRWPAHRGPGKSAWAFGGRLRPGSPENSCATSLSHPLNTGPRGSFVEGRRRSFAGTSCRLVPSAQESKDSVQP